MGQGMSKTSPESRRFIESKMRYRNAHVAWKQARIEEKAAYDEMMDLVPTLLEQGFEVEMPIPL